MQTGVTNSWSDFTVGQDLKRVSTVHLASVNTLTAPHNVLFSLSAIDKNSRMHLELFDGGFSFCTIDGAVNSL